MDSGLIASTCISSLLSICGLDGEVETFLHAPSSSFNKVKRVLLSGILVYVNCP